MGRVFWAGWVYSKQVLAASFLGISAYIILIRFDSIVYISLVGRELGVWEARQREFRYAINKICSMSNLSVSRL